jgi:hypothetical protein
MEILIYPALVAAGIWLGWLLKGAAVGLQRAREASRVEVNGILIVDEGWTDSKGGLHVKASHWEVDEDGS